MPVHFDWTTHERLPLGTDEIERRVYDTIAAVCRDDGCQVIAIGELPDHVPLLVGLSGTITLSKRIKDVKGGSSRFIRRDCRAGEWFAWQKRYAVFGVSPRHVSKVAACIQEQKRHHADGALWAMAEEAAPDEDEADT